MKNHRFWRQPIAGGFLSLESSPKDQVTQFHPLYPRKEVIILLKYTRFIFLLTFLIVVLTACNELSEKERNNYFEKAIPIGQKYFMTHYDTEVEFTSFQINTPMSSTMFLHGYTKDKNQYDVSLTLEFPSLEVKSAGGPSDFIKKRK